MKFVLNWKKTQYLSELRVFVLENMILFDTAEAWEIKTTCISIRLYNSYQNR